MDQEHSLSQDLSHTVSAVTSAQSHTPGPWAYGLDDVDAIWAVKLPEDGGNVICEPPPAALTASFSRWPANARLIVATPEMLAALKWARSCVPFPSDCHAAICAAIARAEAK